MLLIVVEADQRSVLTAVSLCLCFQAAASLFSADSPVTSGPIISDITEVATPIAEDVVSDWIEPGWEPMNSEFKVKTPQEQC